MSIFWLGGAKRFVREEEILPFIYEERFFLPGVIHGGKDYVVNVYLYWAEQGENEGCWAVEVNYYTTALILKAHKADPTHTDYFSDILSSECERFVVENDGTGDFAELTEAWSQSVRMDNDALVKWALEVNNK